MENGKHIESHLKSSHMLRDIVIGMSDGLTVPFALAAGLSGAIDNNDVIAIAGIAEIAAGSIAMGLGGYLAGKTELEHYNNETLREKYEIENMRERELHETRTFFAQLGLSEDLQKKATEEISIDNQRWLDFMMKYELGLEKPAKGRAMKSALNIGMAYAVGGLIPLTPYLIMDHPSDALKYSAIATLICLFIFGYFKSKITGNNPWIGAARIMLIGAAAASAAFAVAKLIG
jgi:VIT1/CCC1 family predicted Fe2+/Mn2+ transporter